MRLLTMKIHKLLFHRINTLVIAVSASVLLAACASVYTTSGGSVGVQRKQYMSSLVSEQALAQEAAQQYHEIISQARSKGVLDSNAAQTKRVRNITQKLVAQAGVFRPDAVSWNWEVHVINSSEVNAWCMPGGKMAVYSGLINNLKLTDHELAAVIGHEIAHALREHSREQVSQQMAASIGITLLGAITGQATADLGSQLSDVMFMLPNSRSHETEADRIGVELSARAGYDPRAAISLWQKMGSMGGSRPPEFLSTHPSPASRMAEITNAAERVMPLYKNAVK